MTESYDVIKQIFDRCVNVITLLPPPIYTFPVRAAAVLTPATLACRMSFELGNRNDGLQVLIACVVAFLSASSLPIEQISEWLHHAGNIPCTLVFAICVFLMFFCPFLLPRWLVSRQQIQTKISKLIFRVLLVLLIANLLITVLKKIIP